MTNIGGNLEGRHGINMNSYQNYFYDDFLPFLDNNCSFHPIALLEMRSYMIEKTWDLKHGTSIGKPKNLSGQSILSILRSPVIISLKSCDVLALKNQARLWELIVWPLTSAYLEYILFWTLLLWMVWNRGWNHLQKVGGRLMG